MVDLETGELATQLNNWFVYIVRCHNGHLYTGIATDVQRRFAEHQANKGAKYLRGRGPLALVFKQWIGTRSLALKIERRVKKLPKDQKERLVRTGVGIEAMLGELSPPL